MEVVEDVQDIEDNNHETMGNCGKMIDTPKAATSSTQTYIDEVGTYKDEDWKSKLKHVNHSSLCLSWEANSFLEDGINLRKYSSLCENKLDNFR